MAIEAEERTQTPSSNLTRADKVRGYIKDFGGLVISLVALGGSIIALYLTRRAVDDFRFTIGTEIPMANPQGNYMIVYAPDALTFINSGNQPVAVLRLQYATHQTIELEKVVWGLPTEEIYVSAV